MNEEDLFQEALSRAPEKRAAFLDAACAGQPQLRAAVDAILAAHDKSGNILDKPPAELGQAVDSEPLKLARIATGEHALQHANAPAPATTDYRPNVEPEAVIAGRYTLVEKIGEGGMGEVWVAKQTEPLKRKVAIKLIKAGMDSRAVLQRFEQERQALALMDHPNIARVLDGGLTPNGQPFFVMELVHGLPVNKFCDESKLTPQQRLELFVPICQAVQHAHHKGIVHRDLKPANILVTLIDGKPFPKVIDFGVAKATGGKLTDESMSTQFGAIVGTLEYMSPEQAGFSSIDIDTRADIYSLGVILYELLTGLRPIDANRLKKAAFTEMVRIIQEEQPSKPSTRLSTDESLPTMAAVRQTEPKKLMALLRGELDWVVMKCLEKQRERRYETASGLARDIQRYLADEPVEARPPSAAYRLKKALRKHRGAVIAASLVVLSLLAGFVGTALGLIRAESRRVEAERAKVNEAEQHTLAVAEKRKAELAEAETLASYRASTDDAIEQLIGSKPDLHPQEKTYLNNTIKRWNEFANRKGNGETSQAIRAEGHDRVAFLWAALGRREEARTEYATACDQYKKLAAAFPDVPKYQKGLATVHHNLGRLLADLGELEGARAEYETACDLQRNLVATIPGNPQYQFDLALTHNNLGNLLREVDQRDAAITEHETACDLLNTLVRAFPKEPEYQMELAGAHNNLGILFVELQRHDAACREYETARDLEKNLIAGSPDEPRYQELLGKTHLNFGLLLARMGQRDAAHKEYEATREFLKELVAAYPAIARYQITLGGSYLNTGILFGDEGMLAESLDWIDLAIRTLTPVHEKERGDAMARYYLSYSHWVRAMNLDELKKHAEAIKDWDRAVELSPGPEQPTYRSGRAMSRLRAGLAAEAVAEVAELTNLPNWPAGQWYNFSCVYAVASGKLPDKKEEYARRAIHLLQRAVNAGYTDAAHMKRDNDLDSLCDREDFKTLLAELDARREKENK